MNTAINLGWDRTETSYFNWLVESVCLDSDPYFGESYWELAQILHDTTFYSHHPMDQNRKSDGIRLRSTWLDLMMSEADELGRDFDVTPESLAGPCTVLELLVGLATRIEDDVMQNDLYGNRAPVWFWAMIHNLGLTKYPDGRNHFGDRMRLIDGVYLWMDRKYEPNGNGGIFPLNTPSKDQRGVELWLQAREWLNENYPE